MGRLCERPGCSENAAVAYGMRIEDLVFWLDVLGESTPSAGGVLCQRHGDSMVVPRGWTLDDLRDPDLHLFRPPRSPGRRNRRGVRRRSASGGDGAQQLELGGLSPEAGTAGVEAIPGAHGVDDAPRVADRPACDEPQAAIEPESADRWTPTFDDADDLDGLLSARSPLLSRAFQGTERHG